MTEKEYFPDADIEIGVIKNNPELTESELMIVQLEREAKARNVKILEEIELAIKEADKLGEEISEARKEEYQRLVYKI